MNRAGMANNHPGCMWGDHKGRPYGWIAASMIAVGSRLRHDKVKPDESGWDGASGVPGRDARSCARRDASSE
jgi:hypothetical protein